MNIKQYIKEIETSRGDVQITFINSNGEEPRFTIGQLCEIALLAIDQRDRLFESAMNPFSVHPKILQSNLSVQKKNNNQELIRVLGF